MDLLTLVPGVALAAGLAAPALRRTFSRQAAVAHARRTLEQSRLVGLRH